MAESINTEEEYMRPPQDFQLEDFHVSSLHLAYEDPGNESKSPDQAACNFGFSIGGHQKDKHRFRLSLRVKVSERDNQKNVGYSVESEIVGYFSIDPDLAEDVMQNHVALNGVAMLYGMLRGIVSSATGNFPQGKFILPSIDARKIILDAMASQKQGH